MRWSLGLGLVLLILPACRLDRSHFGDLDGAASQSCSSNADCDDEIPCTDDVCDLTSGVCLPKTARPGACPAGTECDLNQGCRSPCDPEGCAESMTDKVNCLVGVCNADGNCVAEAHPTCEGDNTYCCGQGSEAGPSNWGECITCADDGNQCTQVACGVDGTCYSDPVPLERTSCEDGDFCNGREVCTGGACTTVENSVPCPGNCVEGRCGCFDVTVIDDCCEDGHGAADCILGEWEPCTFTNPTDCEGTRFRNNLINPSCVAGGCEYESEREPGDCTRLPGDTPMCRDIQYGPWQGCQYTHPICDEQAIEERTVDHYRCVLGNCTRMRQANAERDCQRTADGMECQSDNEASCVAMPSNTCSGQRVITEYRCGSDTCNPQNRSEACDMPNNTRCADGFSCTTNDRCNSSGSCGGNPDDGRCNDGNQCTADQCDPVEPGANNAGCIFPNRPPGFSCSDGLTCTDDQCDGSGNCVSTPNDSNCSQDSNPCTEQVCHPTRGCEVNILEGRNCNDGNPCTSNDDCDSDGVCRGNPFSSSNDCMGSGTRCCDGSCEMGSCP